MKETLHRKIREKSATIGIIGQGYVGLPLAVEFANAGFNVIGFDIDPAKVEKINTGVSYIVDVKSEDLKAVVAKKKLCATADFSRLGDVDSISICVPTPLRKTKDPDISYIAASMEQICKYMKKGALVVLESTTYPGTTTEMVREPLEQKGFKAGKDTFICFSPERVDPGNAVYNTKNTPKVIGGETPACCELGAALYRTCINTVHIVGTSAEAEMVKLLENTFRAVNIALVNELMMMCDRMGINIWNVINAAATKPFGFMPFYPGPGIGGHCIPLDPMYLSWKAKTYDFYNRFIELATDINGNMPYYVIHRVSRILNQHEKPIKNSKILILGMAYKANVDDLRESPGLELYRLLRAEGAYVVFNDPHATSFKSMLGKIVRSTDLTEETLKNQDLIIVVTNHKTYDYGFVVKHAKLILDTRNALGLFTEPSIVRL
ncbi:MAG: UDP-N-acetyl-D-glucosamine dehydrogenase [Candidatus Raymondbacteria bacterium RifOxyA12_full_50_37]|uniref:UDP-N-acetyl-D-glucosamine dehydrogenase n=1 Tax=Candidatus Raymondbacteria bacterium RIFOXYD12_FULL_49_13 TaxID=1817890 RepID=A0A1F7F992_UNCRA|nr:MAG: UDP-N-acetyl-D-glucosamine dehydrogenase [Candidatus Raymondbacteria bacterium RIFOXYA2_FULL_49_16]OGJ90724.1 MAG: UDP-N-acetyl-D-glucosamine dehydrogenase [Candidatus Raymondbacteria bacterium RifOxyA12_full_50_37]OGJ98361.1 MAG: UDP-N-acetyl-D-glucosamine dehydrogenase [Candidatus Raymondbacteria bacterium RIFOXYC2_FULL_50_21]OGK03086.1 MAG: UDP-N-acetyl-D-glucosamine dehydrogenase [Candidatus Raymondbacteria bacterium RIFOXYD12_FULL_49_13]OGK06628.1 MAG: UDP-N-acetyl-D-glucosamine de